jgi:hypothetical protein
MRLLIDVAADGPPVFHTPFPLEDQTNVSASEWHALWTFAALAAVRRITTWFGTRARGDHIPLDDRRTGWSRAGGIPDCDGTGRRQ